jgi:hypothetical protein
VGTASRVEMDVSAHSDVSVSRDGTIPGQRQSSADDSKKDVARRTVAL